MRISFIICWQEKMKFPLKKITLLTLLFVNNSMHACQPTTQSKGFPFKSIFGLVTFGSGLCSSMNFLNKRKQLEKNKPQKPTPQVVANLDLSRFDKNIRNLKDIQKIIVNDRKEKEELRRIKIQEKIDALVLEPQEKDPDIKKILTTNFGTLTKGKLPHVTYAITAGRLQRETLITSRDLDAHCAYNIAHALESGIIIQAIDKDFAELAYQEGLNRQKDIYANQKALYTLSCLRHQKEKNMLSLKSGLSLACAGVGAWLFYRQKR